MTLEFWLDVPAGLENEFENQNLTQLFIGSAKNNGTTTGVNATVRNLRLRFGGRAEGTGDFQGGGFVKLADFAGGYAHVVGVLDFANGEILTYLNGELVDEAEADFQAEAFQPGDVPAAIGAVINGAGEAVNGHDGRIDEVAIYGHALSADRVAAHHAAGSAPAEPE